MNYNHLSSLTDEDLWLRICATNDQYAFTELYNRYWDTMIGACYKRLKCLDAAEEITQEIFIDLYIRRSSIVFNSSIAAYLKAAVKFKVFNYFRAQRVHQSYIEKTLNEHKITVSTPYDALQKKELNEWVLAATAYLPAKCKEVFILSKIKDLPQKSIAKTLGISLSTVKKHLTKAHQILREKFNYNKVDFLTLFLLFFLAR